jgi:hypothetical protein
VSTKKTLKAVLVLTLGTLIAAFLGSVAISRISAAHPLLRSTEERIQFAAQATGLTEEEVKLFLDDRLGLTHPGARQATVTLGKVSSYFGMWGGEALQVNSELSLEASPEKEEDWAGAITGSPSLSTAEVNAVLEFDARIPEDMLGQRIPLQASMDVIYPYPAPGVNTYRNKRERIESEITLAVTERSAEYVLNALFFRNWKADAVALVVVAGIWLAATIAYIRQLRKPARMEERFLKNEGPPSWLR